MAEPRSAGRPSWSCWIFCFSQVSSLSVLANSAPSRGDNHPTNNIAAEDIEDDVQVKVGPLGRSAQLGDVPTPQLIRGGGQQFRLLISRMDELVAALARCSILFQNPIHGSSRAKILAFIEQSRMDGCRRAVLEALGIQQGANRFAFV